MFRLGFCEPTLSLERENAEIKETQLLSSWRRQPQETSSGPGKVALKVARPQVMAIDGISKPADDDAQCRSDQNC